MNRIIAALAIAVAISITGCSTSPGSGMPWPNVASQSAAQTVPQPITRADLMRQYATIRPMDGSATPETMDDFAGITCTQLRHGISADTVITTATETYQAQATEVIRLLVSYRCPEYLKSFR